MRNYAVISVAAVFIFTGALLYSTNPETSETGFRQFESQQQFQEMISTDSAMTGGTGGSIEQQARTTSDFSASTAEYDVKRTSSTNIQVSGVGEPDILKNTGEKIYYSPEKYSYWSKDSNTSVFKTLPAENFSKTSELPATGKMFLMENSIISLGENITAFKRESHEEKWSQGLNASIEAARKINESIYLVLRKDPDRGNPCPVRPMESLSMPCTSFYHPGNSERVDTTYSIVRLDPETGEIRDSTGFTGSYSNTVVYVSRDSIYLTYSRTEPRIEVITGFLDSRGSEYLDQETIDRIDELRSYDISDESLEREIQRSIQEYFRSLGDEKAQEKREQLENALDNYSSERKRELSTTEIAKFSLDLELEAQGEVPGTVNDQFSLDESDEGLRIATTVGDSWSFETEPENDLYTLNENLEVSGSVKGMGVNERIYSVRYIDDRAYVVTYRRIDPFHVIDLSNHEDPRVKGKLKLPGFSSYLHPLQKNRILGIGEENGSVKAVIFDVSGDEPEVIDSEVLDDSYSRISDSHHAFQIDREKKVFFLPGSQGGYFFSYNQSLERKHFVNISGVQRGAFTNQNFYVFGEENASVIDMRNFETVKKIRFRNVSRPEPVPLPEPVIER